MTSPDRFMVAQTVAAVRPTGNSVTPPRAQVRTRVHVRTRAQVCTRAQVRTRAEVHTLVSAALVLCVSKVTIIYMYALSRIRPIIFKYKHFLNSTRKHQASNHLSVDCTWLTWSEWSACNVTCGYGGQSRTRVKDGPRFGGVDCAGDASDRRQCNQFECPSKTLNTSIQLFQHLIIV